MIYIHTVGMTFNQPISVTLVPHILPPTVWSPERPGHRFETQKGEAQIAAMQIYAAMPIFEELNGNVDLLHFSLHIKI